jgi:uncharacterized FlaG/YvyC family protein
MKLGPLPPLDLGASLSSTQTQQNAKVPDRQVVSAVRALNDSQALGQDRQLVYRRDQKTGSMMIQIVNRGTGDVLDQIPAEVMLRMRADLELELKHKAASQDPTLA